MTNGSGKKKGQLYIDLWNSLVSEYPSLQQIDNPIDMATGKLSSQAVRAAKYQRDLAAQAAQPPQPVQPVQMEGPLLGTDPSEWIKPQPVDWMQRLTDLSAIGNLLPDNMAKSLGKALAESGQLPGWKTLPFKALEATGVPQFFKATEQISSPARGYAYRQLGEAGNIPLGMVTKGILKALTGAHPDDLPGAVPVPDVISDFNLAQPWLTGINLAQHDSPSRAFQTPVYEALIGQGHGPFMASSTAAEMAESAGIVPLGERILAGALTDPVNVVEFAPGIGLVPQLARMAGITKAPMISSLAKQAASQTAKQVPDVVSTELMNFMGGRDIWDKASALHPPGIMGGPPGKQFSIVPGTGVIQTPVSQLPLPFSDLPARQTYARDLYAYSPEELFKQGEVVPELGPLGQKLAEVRGINDEASRLIDDISNLYPSYARDLPGVTPTGRIPKRTWLNLPQSIKTRAEKLIELSNKSWMGDQSPFTDVESVVRFIHSANIEQVARLESYVTPGQNLIIDKFVNEFERAVSFGKRTGTTRSYSEAYDISRWPTQPSSYRPYKMASETPYTPRQEAVYATGPITDMVNAPGNVLSRGELRSVLEARLEYLPSTRRQLSFPVETLVGDDGLRYSTANLNLTPAQEQVLKSGRNQLHKTGKVLETGGPDPVAEARRATARAAGEIELATKVKEFEAANPGKKFWYHGGGRIDETVSTSGMIESGWLTPDLDEALGYAEGFVHLVDDVAVKSAVKSGILFREGIHRIIDEPIPFTRSFQADVGVSREIPFTKEALDSQERMRRLLTAETFAARAVPEEAATTAARAVRDPQVERRAALTLEGEHDRVLGYRQSLSGIDLTLPKPEIIPEGVDFPQVTRNPGNDEWKDIGEILQMQSADWLENIANKIGKWNHKESNLLKRAVKTITVGTNPTVAAVDNPGGMLGLMYATFRKQQISWLGDAAARLRASNPFRSRKDHFRLPDIKSFLTPGAGRTVKRPGVFEVVEDGVSNSYIEWVNPETGMVENVRFGPIFESPGKAVEKGHITLEEAKWIRGTHALIKEMRTTLEDVMPAGKRKTEFKERIAIDEAIRKELKIEEYFPRIRKNTNTDLLEVVPSKAPRGDPKPGFMRQRLEPSMEQALEKGISYYDPIEALGLTLRTMHKLIRDEILLETLRKGGHLQPEPTQGFTQSKYFTNYDQVYIEETVSSGLNKVLGPSLEEALGTNANIVADGFRKFARSADMITGATKTSQTGLIDIGTVLQQNLLVPGLGQGNLQQFSGIVTLGGRYTGPAHWAKSTVKGINTYFSELGFGHSGVVDKWRTQDEMVTQARVLGKMNFDTDVEWFRGLNTLRRVPFAGPLLGRTGQAASAAFNMTVSYARAAMFDSYLATLKVGLRKDLETLNPAYKLLDDTRKNQVIDDYLYGRPIDESLGVTKMPMDTRLSLERLLVRIGQRTDGMIGLSDLSSMGMSRMQQDIENIVVFFGSTYTRSVLGQLNVLVGAGAMPKETSYIMARAIAAWSSLFVGGRFMMEMKNGASPEEAARLSLRALNPRNGREFMAVPIKGGYYGIGSLQRSLTMFIGAASQWDDWEFDDVPTALRTNPFMTAIPQAFLRFWRARTPPLTSLLWDSAEGEDFLGQHFSWKHLIDPRDPKRLLTSWVNRGGPFNVELVMDSVKASTPFGTMLAALGLSTLAGRYVPYGTKDVKQEMFVEFIRGDPATARKLDWTFLTRVDELSTAELNMIKDWPPNADRAQILEKMESEQDANQIKKGDVWGKIIGSKAEWGGIVSELADQVVKDSDSLLRPDMTYTELKQVQPERLFSALYPALRQEYYTLLDKLFEDVDPSDRKAIDAAHKPKKAEIDYWILLGGDSPGNNKIFSEAYERVVKAYQKSMGLEPVDGLIQSYAGWDWNEYYLRLDALKAMYGDDLIEKTRTASRKDKHPMEKAMLDANDYIRENYTNLNISPVVLDKVSQSFPALGKEESQRLYIQYVRAGYIGRLKMRTKLAERNVDAGIFEQILTSTFVRRLKNNARRSDPKLEDLLWKWRTNISKPIQEYYLYPVGQTPRSTLR
jgi:hypothetical protein